MARMRKVGLTRAFRRATAARLQPPSEGFSFKGHAWVRVCFSIGLDCIPEFPCQRRKNTSPLAGFVLGIGDYCFSGCLNRAGRAFRGTKSWDGGVILGSNVTFCLKRENISFFRGRALRNVDQPYRGIHDFIQCGSGVVDREGCAEASCERNWKRGRYDADASSKGGRDQVMG